MRRYATLCFTAIALSACGDVANAILMESRTIREGTFRGFAIGSSKAIALRNAEELAVSAVKPIPAEWFSIDHSNLRELSRATSAAEGIRLSNDSGLAIDLFFDGDVVTLIRESVPARNNKWFHKGDKATQVVATLKELVSSDRSLRVTPLVLYEGDGWVRLAKDTNAFNVLKRYSGWTFEVTSDKPAGAIFELYFEADRLSRIEYRRPRLRK